MFWPTGNDLKNEQHKTQERRGKQVICARNALYRPIGIVSMIAGVPVFTQIVRSTSRMTSMRADDNMAAGYDVTRTW